MKALLFTLSALTLASCSILKTQPNAAGQSDITDQSNIKQTIAERPIAAPEAFQPGRFTTSSAESHVTSGRTNLTIQHYVRQLMQEMLLSMQDVSEQTPLAVAGFVFLDGDFNQGSLLGNQIAESFMHELHNVGLQVIDFKVTDFIRVTPQGDFIHSRDVEELNENLAAQYAVGGTLSQHKDGVIVNARMIQINNKVVLASAQSLIPNAVVKALHPSSTTQGMMLIKSAN
ncbi:FlgO family outer membrane protein [Rheinheimera gaetbuli]